VLSNGTVVVGCRAPERWTALDREKLLLESMRLKPQFPESARALVEYSEMRAAPPSITAAQETATEHRPTHIQPEGGTYAGITRLL